MGASTENEFGACAQSGSLLAPMYSEMGLPSVGVSESKPRKELSMSRPKLLPLSGIAVVALIALGVVIGGATPDNNASAASVLSFYEAHHGRQIAATFLLAASVPFLVLFAATLAASVWPREPGVRPIWQLVLLAGSAVAGGTILLAAAVHFPLADSASQLPPSSLKTLNVVDADSWIALNAGIGVMMLGAGGSLLTRAAGSRWLGRTALLLGVLLFIPFADFFALLASGLWILAASVSLSRRPGAPAYAAGLAALVVVAALVGAVPASAGGNAGSTQVETVDPAGAVFTCPSGDYTVTGGELRIGLHLSFATDGSVHVRQSHLPLGVTLSDGTTDTVYRLVGANSAGGNIDIGGGDGFEFTDTTFFNILTPSRGVVARVAGVEHVNPAGGGFSFVFGDCEAPQD
jgi:hypothetical protein